MIKKGSNAGGDLRIKNLSKEELINIVRDYQLQEVNERKNRTTEKIEKRLNKGEKMVVMTEKQEKKYQAQIKNLRSERTELRKQMYRLDDRNRELMNQSELLNAMLTNVNKILELKIKGER